jgi:hypothetical protein
MVDISVQNTPALILLVSAVSDTYVLVQSLSFLTSPYVVFLLICTTTVTLPVETMQK